MSLLVKLLSLPSPNRMAPRMSELNLRPSNVKHAHSMLYQYGCCVLKSSLEPEFLDEWLQKIKQIPITSLYQAQPYDNTHFTYGGCKLFLAAVVLAQVFLTALLALSCRNLSR